MDKDTLQIIIMVAGFAITIITFLLKFPSRDEMNKRFLMIRISDSMI